ncbi:MULTISPECIES: hypothetical protein [Bacillaceae]|nr:MULTISPECIES: hypothetical protein [Bacillaceae]CAH0270475.1 hypothetical protein SRABI134_03721 [Peribacillus sp. Bi134]
MDERICEEMGNNLVNKKMGLLGLLGLLFMFGIYISQWNLFGMVIGIGGG